MTIAPLLAEAEGLVELIAGQVDSVIVDRMNGHHADSVYAKYGLKDKNTDLYFTSAGKRIETERRLAF